MKKIIKNSLIMVIYGIMFSLGIIITVWASTLNLAQNGEKLNLSKWNELIQKINELINNKANDSQVVKISGNQSIDGIKTFNDDIIFGGKIGIKTNNPANELSINGLIIRISGSIGNGIVQCSSIVFNGNSYTCNTPYLSLPLHLTNGYHIRDSINTRAAVCYALGSKSYNGNSTVTTNSNSGNRAEIDTTNFLWKHYGTSGQTYISSINCIP